MTERTAQETGFEAKIYSMSCDILAKDKEIASLKERVAELTYDRDVFKEWWERAEKNIEILTNQLNGKI